MNNLQHELRRVGLITDEQHEAAQKVAKGRQMMRDLQRVPAVENAHLLLSFFTMKKFMDYAHRWLKFDPSTEMVELLAHQAAVVGENITFRPESRQAVQTFFAELGTTLAATPLNEAITVIDQTFATMDPALVQ